MKKLDVFANEVYKLAQRKGKYPETELTNEEIFYYLKKIKGEVVEAQHALKYEEADNFTDELCDVILRTISLFKKIFPKESLEKWLESKHEYNKTRTDNIGRK